MNAITNSFRSMNWLALFLSFFIIVSTVLLGQYALLLLLLCAVIFIEANYPKLSLYLIGILILLPINYNFSGLDINASIPYLLIAMPVKLVKTRGRSLTILTRFDLFPLLYLLIGGFSIIDRVSSIQGWMNGYGKIFLIPVILYFYIKLSDVTVKQVLKVIALSLTIFSLYALFEFFFVYSASINFVGDSEYKLSGGILAQGNGLAMNLERIIPFFILLSFTKINGNNGTLYKFMLLFFTLMLFLTLSRGAWFAFSIIILLSILVLRRMFVFFSITILLTSAIAFIEPIRTRLFTDESTLYFREELWDVTFSMIKDHLLFGIPFNDFVYYYDKHFDTVVSLSRAHNIFLDILVFTGVVGALFFAVFFCTIFIHGVRFLIKHKDSAPNMEKTMVLGFMLMLLMMFLHGQIDSPMFSYSRDMFLWLEFAVFAKVMQGEISSATKVKE